MNTQPLQEATGLAEKIAFLCPEIDLIFLDQWRRSRERDEWRLTYLGQKIGICSNDCPNCSVYSATGGEDNPAQNKKWVTTLVPATETDLQNYAGSQHYLNCKSLDQYVTSFVHCFKLECHSREEISDELDYVVGFKVVYHRGREILGQIEDKIKQEIIKKVSASLDKPRRELFLVVAKDKGLVR